MPNASQRITDSTIKSMNSMFFMLNSLDDRIDIANHPKYHILINNVSRYEEDNDSQTIKNQSSNAKSTNLSHDQRIFDIKS